MNISRWTEVEAIPHYLRDEETPYALPIVIRLEKGSEGTILEADAFKAVGSALLAMLSDDKWDDEVKAWMRGRIRKIVRRARASAWSNLLEKEHYYAKVGNAEVVILKPYILDEISSDIKKLQVQGIELEKSSGPLAPSSLLIAMNPEIPMSSGKAMAQFGHAVQIAVLNSPVDVLEAWEKSGFPISVAAWEETEMPFVEVRDAGFTEVASGSLTCRAKFS